MSEKLNGGLRTEESGFLWSVLSQTLTAINSIVSFIRGYLYSSIYSSFYDSFMKDRAERYRREIYQDIGDVVPHDKKDGRLRILEIGAGPGCNFDYFPKPCLYTTVEKNGSFEKVLLSNIKKHPGIELERFITGAGEDMSLIPSNSVDIVCSSSVHCCLDSSQQVLKEIQRILVPGGRYYFYEHVLDEPGTLRKKIQKFLAVTRIHPCIANGCTFVDFEKEIREANFESCHGKRYFLKNDGWGYYAVYVYGSLYGGYAVTGQ